MSALPASATPSVSEAGFACAKPRAAVWPILRAFTQSRFDWIVFDVLYDANEMLRVANVAVERFLLPKLSTTNKNLVRFIRGI